MCLMSGGRHMDIDLSPQHGVSCMGNGECSGGFQHTYWDYVKQNGMVSEKCMPYQSGADGSVPSCPAMCADGTSLNQSRVFVDSYYALPPDVNTIKAEIVYNGPVQALFTVYHDFYSYGRGVYNHVTGDKIGNHVVTLLGYGTDKRTGKGLEKINGEQVGGMEGILRYAKETVE
ncbi:cathepsin B-like [Acrasis kona]|uniref:Cathepsin B-like n=1 Tax=Acrasis kona TaxID=1008807 RepID=A0AAW2Z3M9_9EUKA